MGALRNNAHDGATGRIRFGAQAILLTKCSIPKESTKTELVRYIGEQYAEAETLGVLDIDKLEAETTTTAFVGQILPHWKRHGNNVPEFPITITQRHPLVTGAYSIICDRCRLLNLDEAIENSEKANIIKLSFSCKRVLRRGADGQWKMLGIDPALPSAEAQALMF